LRRALTPKGDRSAAWALAAQLGTARYLGTLLGLLPFLILLFPTGRLLSPRWRPVAWTLGLVTGLYLTARLLTPGPVSPGLPANPLGAGAAAGPLQQTPPGWIRPRAFSSSSKPSPASPPRSWSWPWWPRWCCDFVALRATN